MNESKETEEIKIFPSTLTCCKDSMPYPTVSQYQLDTPVTQDTRHLCLTQILQVYGMRTHIYIIYSEKRSM